MAKTIAQLLAEQNGNTQPIIQADAAGNVITSPPPNTGNTTQDAPPPAAQTENVAQFNPDGAAQQAGHPVFNKQPVPAIGGADANVANTGMSGNNTNAPDVQAGGVPSPYDTMSVDELRDTAKRLDAMCRQWAAAHRGLTSERNAAVQSAQEAAGQRDAALRRAEVMEAGGRAKPVTITIEGDAEIVRSGRVLHGTVGARTDHVPTTEELNAGAMQTPRVS